MNAMFARGREFIQRKPRFSIFLGLIFAGLMIAGFAAGTKQYPILVVNGTSIPASRFEKNYAAAAIYYQHLVQGAASNATATAALQQLTPQDLETDVLDQLVMAVLVEDGARQYAGNDLQELVRQKIDHYANDAEFKQGVEQLYGMSFADFRSEVLVPQAERDILSGRLFLEGKSANDWLKDARKSARVSVLSSKFRWDGEKIVAAQ